MNSESTYQMLMKIISEDINTFNLIKSLPIIDDINNIDDWIEGVGGDYDITTSNLFYNKFYYIRGCNKDNYSRLIKRGGWIIYKLSENINDFKVLYSNVSDEQFAELIKLSKKPNFEQLLNFI